MMKICIVIDGYSTGKQYARFLKEAGYVVLHIQSDKNLPDFITRELEPNNYKQTYIYHSLEEIILEVKKHGKPDFIIPGSDTGVELADLLSHTFNTTFKNSLEISPARRNKFLMGELVNNSGIKRIKQFKTSTFICAKEWIFKEKIDFPVVVKPIKSGSGEGFYLCKNNKDLENAFLKLTGIKDLFNQINHEVLVQEYITGPEYVVNTVSFSGTHFVSDFYFYHKKITEDGSSIYDAIEFLPLNFEHADLLKEYAFRILNTFEIDYGPAHIEIIIHNGEPVLVEIGARPAGADLDLNIIKKTYDYSQIELSFIAYTNSNLYFKLLKKIEPALKNSLMMVFLNSDRSGKIDKLNVLSIMDLPSYKKIELFCREGDYVKKAAHLDDAVGVVYLQHKDKEILKKDHAFLQRLPSCDYMIFSDQFHACSP